MTVATFGRLTGVDLGFVPVVRSAGAGRDAAEHSARAYTRGGVVHLPEGAGPPDRHDTGALLGHELTHVLQQRALGSLADEHGPLGDLLEAEARDVEQVMRGEHPAPDPTSWSWADGAGALRALHRTWPSEHGFSDTTAATHSPDATAPVQRAPLAPESTPLTHVGDPPVDVPVPVPAPQEEDSQRLVYPADVQSETVASPEPVALAGLNEEDVTRAVQRMLPDLTAPPLDLGDPLLLDALANGLYGRLRSRLRGELIADRERAGCLTEFH